MGCVVSIFLYSIHITSDTIFSDNKKRIELFIALETLFYLTTAREFMTCAIKHEHAMSERGIVRKWLLQEQGQGHILLFIWLFDHSKVKRHKATHICAMLKVQYLTATDHFSLSANRLLIAIAYCTFFYITATLTAKPVISIWIPQIHRAYTLGYNSLFTKKKKLFSVEPMKFENYSHVYKNRVS